MHQNLSLLTDFYQLTMLAGYFKAGKLKQRSIFDLYFRKLPLAGGFCLAGGLSPALDYLENLRFTADEIDYLKGLGHFAPDFLEWLADFRFRGSVRALPEGTLVFAGEPMLVVEADLPEAQLVESALLNMVNFQTLIATRAARLKVAAQGGTILEFGLRRAQGIDGSLAASRAAYLGGCDATSNTLAGKLHGIPVKGTHAHSWIMSFDDELSAFRAYADCYPNSCLLLVDTYDTLASGVPNAITVAKELRQQGHELVGIRLDSGDLALLSKEARRMLDEAGFPETKIVASNDLDERLIEDLLHQGARIDIWGVGTNLVTSKGQPALGGVYKLVAAEKDGHLEPRIKISSNPIKTTIPGVKQVWRGYDAEGTPLGDVLTLEDEKPSGTVSSHHPLYAHHQQQVEAHHWEPLLVEVMRDGRRVSPAVPLAESRQRALASIEALPDESKRLSNPQLYWVGLSSQLFALRTKLLGLTKH